MQTSKITMNSEGKYLATNIKPCDDQVITRLPKEMKQALLDKTKEKNMSISELTRSFYLQFLNS
ncbi:hypothetical protein AWB71_02576 [Caballeronia peredens]|nr:hypothetical protein AWB71_02576 [Caballeronia peredens]